MSRFLKRLAEHAMGVSQPARSASAAPYASAPLLSEQVGADAPLTFASAPALKPIKQRGTPPVRERAEDPTPPAALPTTQLEKPSDMSTMIPRSLPPSVSRLPMEAVGTPPVEPEHAQARPRVSELEAKSTGARSAEQHPRAPEPELPRREDAQVASKSGNVPRTAASVERLLPPAHRTEAISSNHRFDGATRQATSAVEETTEIHVSIGRIEIAAPPQTPASPKAVAPRRPAPMSLDEYLSKRYGGRP